MGLTTCAETSDLANTRSDCHAWGASPNIEFYRTVLGIDSDGPAFSRVKIEPHLGSISNIGGEIPHPKGKISVEYKAANGKINATINLPEKVTGRFLWNNKSILLKPGKNQISTNYKKLNKVSTIN